MNARECVCVCVCSCVCEYVCECVCVCICVGVCVWVCLGVCGCGCVCVIVYVGEGLRVCMRKYVCTGFSCMHLSACMEFLWACACVFVCLCVCICVRPYASHKYIHNLTRIRVRQNPIQIKCHQILFADVKGKNSRTHAQYLCI